MATTPSVVRALATDGTAFFWAALLRQIGADQVLTLVDGLGSSDVGLGLFDALLDVAPEALQRAQERPDLMRAVLLRSAQGSFVPSPAFYERVWAHPRRPEEIRDIDQLHAGAWLQELIERSSRWQREERTTLLRWLAQQSQCSDVREECLRALLKEPPAASTSG